MCLYEQNKNYKGVRMFKYLLTILIIFQLTTRAFSDEKKGETSVNDISNIENFTLPDVDGNLHSLDSYKSSKAIVLMFVATQCPISNDYNERMVKITAEYSDKGISFIGINSNKQESVDEIREHSKKNKFNFLVLKDNNNIIADKLNASVTPEIYVINPKFEVLYHGRIDDSRRLNEIKSHDLRNTLDDILAGKDIEVKRTKAFGCTIKRISK
jgi:peroxiredoxin